MCLEFLMNSLSLAVSASGTLRPNGDFQDEHRILGRVDPSAITGISLSSTLAQTPLTDVHPMFEPMKPQVRSDYIERVGTWIASITGESKSEELNARLERYHQASRAGKAWIGLRRQRCRT